MATQMAEALSGRKGRVAAQRELWAGLRFFAYMAGKLAFAVALFIASLTGGVALGSYTIGGFRIDDPPDIIGALAFVESPDPGAPGMALEHPVSLPQVHRCTGCDAGLHRERDGSWAPDAYEAAWQDDATGADAWGHEAQADVAAQDVENERASDPANDDAPYPEIAPEGPVHTVLALAE